MTRSSPITVLLEAGSNQASAAAIGTDRIVAERPLATRRDASPFYVDEPDIPEGMTCATWRRQRRPRREPGLFARVRVRRLAALCMRSLGLASMPNSAIDPRME